MSADHAHRQPPSRRGGGVVSLLAFGLVWFALVVPDQLGRLTPGSVVRLPIEGLLLVALALLLPARARRVLAAVAGVAVGLLVVLKVLDFAFFAVLGKSFSPRTDWSYLRSAVELVQHSAGRWWAAAAVAAAALLVAGLLTLVWGAVSRLVACTTVHPRSALWTVSVLAVAWLACANLGVTAGGAPIAATVSSGLTREPIAELKTGDDPFANVPAQNLLAGLRGKNVLVVFVESYGRVAVEGSPFAPSVTAVLASGTSSLRSAGYEARSAYLTSPTYAGISWLAHSTLQSGLWIDSQRRYNELLRTDRLTLSAAFKKAGWRTVADVPSNGSDWPEGTAFYHYDQVYDRRNVGYAGPDFGFAAVPDQYTLAAFQRAELSPPRRRPVMAEIDLISSHGPWAPLPRLVDWDALGDGSIFAGMPSQGQSPDDLLGHPDQIQAAYAESIRYSLGALLSFVRRFGDDNLVLIIAGDHQPASVVSGPDPDREVPVTIIARDPRVLARIADWDWQTGLIPDAQSPVWPMDAFRDRFLTAFGPA